MATAGGRYLPQVSFTESNSVGVVAPQETLNQTATSPSAQQAQCAAANTVLPVWYGTGRLGARIADLGIYQGRLVLFCVWGRGPHDALVSWTIDDKAPPAGVISTHYDGTQVAADPVLAAVYGAGYADVLPGVAYSVIQVPAAASAGWPQVAAIWRGRKLYDPRTGLTVWSANRALWLADFLASSVYGAGKMLDWDSVADAADACDELVGGAPRRTGGGLILDTRQDTEAWIETLRTYAGCSVIDEGGPVRLIPNRPRAPVFDFSWADGNFIAMSALRTPDLSDIPTVMEIKWTDTSQIPWREVSAFAPDGGVPAAGKDIRLSTVSLPGIHDASQAKREAVERLNTLNLCVLSADLEAFAEGTRIEPGDRVRVTFPHAGLNLKEFLVQRRAGVQGRYSLALLETDPAQYSDVVVTESTVPDTDWPDPADPPAPTGLAVAEEVFQLEDGRWSTRLRISWDASAWPYLRQYRVVVKSLYVIQAEGTPDEPVFVTGEVREEAPYSIEVYTRSHYAESAAATTAITPLGKWLQPANIATISAYEVGGEVHVTVGASTDKDLKGLECRWVATGGTWAQGKFLDFKPAASGVGAVMTSKLVPVGTWDILACGLDSVGQYSPVPARTPVTVTLDVAAFLVASYDHTAPTLTNMAEYRLGPDDPTRYFISSDGIALGTKLPGALNQYSGRLADLHGALTSTWLGEAEDFGLMLAGNWQGTADVEDVSGAHVSSIGLSPDNAAWTYAAGLSQKANGRFGRLKHETTGTMIVRIGTQNLRIDAVPLEEVGEITTLASGGALVNLVNDYVALKSLTLTPIGSGDLNAVADEITVGAGGSS